MAPINGIGKINPYSKVNAIIGSGSDGRAGAQSTRGIAGPAAIITISKGAYKAFNAAKGNKPEQPLLLAKKPEHEKNPNVQRVKDLLIAMEWHKLTAKMDEPATAIVQSGTIAKEPAMELTQGKEGYRAGIGQDSMLACLIAISKSRNAAQIATSLAPIVGQMAAATRAGMENTGDKTALLKIDGEYRRFHQILADTANGVGTDNGLVPGAAKLMGKLVSTSSNISLALGALAAGHDEAKYATILAGIGKQLAEVTEYSDRMKKSA